MTIKQENLTNSMRSGYGQRAIDEYSKFHPDADGDYPTALRDMLTDLFHFVGDNEMAAAMAMAHNHYVAELEEELP